MKSILQILILVMILFAGSVAGIAQPDNQAPPPPPPPALDYSIKRWKEFSSTEGQFKVLLPGSPTASEQKQTTDIGELALHLFNYKGVIVYDVMYVDLPVNVEDPLIFKKAFEGMRESMLSSIAQTNPRIIKETDFQMDNHPGKFLQIDLGGNATVRMRYIAVKSRVYTIVATSGKAYPNLMGSENDFEEIAMNFLNSFQLVKP
jgi:hypothetical protein